MEIYITFIINPLEINLRYNWRHMISWDDSYTIAQILKQKFPEIHLEDVSLNMIYEWTINLPEFEDDPDIVNDEILLSILQEWYEEVNPV